MATIGFSDLRRGITLELDGQPYEVMSYTRHKMQQRAPVTRLKLKNLLNGNVTEKTFQAYDTSFTPANVDSRTCQYLYTDGQFFHFMDMQTYEQYEVTKDQIGLHINYLKEELTFDISFFNGGIIGITPPTFVNLKVTESPPGLKGDTAQGGTKPATLETGLSLNVPLFVNPEDIIKIDTRNGQYVERVS